MSTIANKGAPPKAPTKIIRIPPRAVSVRRIFGPPAHTVVQIDGRNAEKTLVFRLITVTGAELIAPLAIPNDVTSFAVSCASEADLRRVRIEFVLDSCEIVVGS